MRMMADASSEPYVAFRTLVEAQAHPEGVVILEGDYGGQIYVAARAASVGCSEEALAGLLAELDSQSWKNPVGAKVLYEALEIGEGVPGGMGGGEVRERVWIHDRLRWLEDHIVAVLEGRSDRVHL